DGLELSVHKDDRAEVFLRDNVVPVGDSSFALAPTVGDPDLELFRRFRFPLLPMTKLDMERVARENDFLDLMEMTWFCHTPVNGKPCGGCLPCQFAIAEGMARRVPARRAESKGKLKCFLRSIR